MNEFRKLGDDPEVLNFLADIQSLAAKGDPSPESDSDCPDCDGYGYIVTPDDVKVCHCLQERKGKRRLDKSNIPIRYKNKDLENFKATIDSRRLALRQVKRFIDEFDLADERPGLFLYGAAGTGKTHLAVGAVKELVARGYSCLFYNMVTLIGDLRQSHGYDLDREILERLDRLYEVDVLVLDDLGAGKLSEFVLEKTYSLIDQRYSNNQCLIVTSNLPMAELEKQITYPVFSRVRGMCFTVTTGELDYRNPDLAPKKM